VTANVQPQAISVAMIIAAIEIGIVVVMVSPSRPP